MLYISAQPAEYYFLWQLEIQLQNFEEMGILSQNIHVVLSYNEDQGIPKFYDEFAQNNKQAQFFFYPDKRVESKYLSSIRPHILKQHFDKYPELERMTICYHDSDIIFRERLDEENLSKDDFWYFSDTRNYVGSSYLKRFGNDFFTSLCREVSIDPRIVENHECYSGGAQHIMKGVTSRYWSLVEEDSERIYGFIKDHNAKLEKNQKQAQAWCADMWAVLWCAWKMNKEVRLHDELLFSWPKDHISRYDKLKIFHNSGVFSEDKHDYFCKLLYKDSSPYHVDFSSIKKDHCSIEFVKMIEKFALKKKKIVLRDLSIVIYLSKFNEENLNRVYQNINYLYKHLSVQVHVVEHGDHSLFNARLVKDKCAYTLLRGATLDVYIKKIVKTEFFIFVDANILLPIENITQSAELLRKNPKTCVYPMNEVVEINKFQYNLFKDTLQNELKRNANISVNNASLDYLECFAISKDCYLKSGAFNKYWNYFYEDGFNLERQARMRILGLSIFIVPLHAYKLFPNSNRVVDEKKNSAEKYLELCNGTKNELKRKLAQKGYSNHIPFGKKIDLSKQRIGICKTKNEVQIVEQFQLDKYIKIKIDQYKSVINNLPELIKSAQSQRLNFLILFNESIEIKNETHLHHFWNAISEMNKYGIQVLSAISSGGFKEERKVSQEIFWIDVLPSSCVLVLHHSIFKSILEEKIDQNISIEAFLDKLTTHKGTITPFLGFPITPNTTDEKSILAHKDRIGYIKRLEDKLIWIRDNEKIT